MNHQITEATGPSLLACSVLGIRTRGDPGVVSEVGGWMNEQRPQCLSEARTAAAISLFTDWSPHWTGASGRPGPRLSCDCGVPGLQLVPGTQMVVQTWRVEEVLGAITEHSHGPGAF